MVVGRLYATRFGDTWYRSVVKSLPQTDSMSPASVSVEITVLVHSL